ncbi:hypothetical protein UT300005_11220 [Clostridium sp. CTA-5]
MKLKLILVNAFLIFSIAIMYGCKDSKDVETVSENNVKSEISSEANSTKEDSKLKSEEITSTDSKTNKEVKKTTNKDNTKIENDKSKECSNKNLKKNSINEGNSNLENKQTTNPNLIFKSNLGFSITFPTNWENKYKVIEGEKSVSVYFKSSDKNVPEKSGLFFTIIEKDNSIDETIYDSIEGKKYVTLNNKIYFIGGPTDIALSEEVSDFNVFLSMNKERKKVIDTIK